MSETIDISLAPADESELDAAPELMKQPLSESITLHVQRVYPNHKSRVQIGVDLHSLLAHAGADPGAVLAAEVARLRSLLDEKENALKRKESGA